MISPASGAVKPPRVLTTLITERSTSLSLTANCEVDTRTALTRGLAEYISQLSIQMPGGRELRFKSVKDTYAEPEDRSAYPSACVYSFEKLEYDASRFTPGVNKNYQLPPPDGRYFIEMAEAVLIVTVETWSTDPKERMGLAKMLEDAFNPVDFMYGFRLDLPHYYNARAEFALKSIEYIDTEDDAMKRHRKSIFMVEGRVPLIRLANFPAMQIHQKIIVVESPLADDC